MAYKGPLEKNHPEKAGELVVDLAADPYNNIKKLAQAHGIPVEMVRGMIRRMQARHLPLKQEVQRVNNKDLLELIDDRALRMLQYMDDYTIANAPLRELAVAFGILAEKRQLLRGEPTQIIDDSERKNINELMVAAIKEAQRRGMTIDVTPFEVSQEEGATMRAIPANEPKRDDVDKTYRKLKKFTDVPEMS